MIFLRPYNTILATVFLTVLGTVSLYQVGPINFRPYQIPLLLSVAMFSSQLLLYGKKILLPNSLKVLFLFFVAIVVSLLASRFPVVTIKQSILLSLYVIICFLIINTCDSEKKFLLLHKTIIFSCLIACIYGVILFILTNLPGVEKEGGYWYTRPKSFFVEPNEFGLYLTFAFGYIFSELISNRRIIRKSLLWFTFVLVVLLLVPNMSRGSWLGCVVVMAMVFYYHNKLRLRRISFVRIIKFVVLMSVLLILVLTLVSRYITVRGDTTVFHIVKSRVVSLAGGRDATYLERLEGDKKALEAMLRYPLTGIGFGNAFTILEGGIRSNKSGLHGIPEIGNATSSCFLADIGAETGIIGLIIFVLFLILLLEKGAMTIKNVQDDKTAVVFIGAFASCIGLLANGVTYPILLMPFFWISAGVLNAEIFSK